MKISNPTARLGEDVAVSYLKTHGYKILERNFRESYGEIDIIAIDESEKEKVLAFIEVKTRTSTRFGTPFEAITYWKLRSLTKTAEFYKHSHKNLPDLMRIDGLAVLLDKEDHILGMDLMKNIS